MKIVLSPGFSEGLRFGKQYESCIESYLFNYCLTQFDVSQHRREQEASTMRWTPLPNLF